MNVVFYTIGCPRCVMLQKLLDQKQIDYQMCNDVEEMNRLGLLSAPALMVDGQLMTYEKAMQWITNVSNNTENSACQLCAISENQE